MVKTSITNHQPMQKHTLTVLFLLFFSANLCAQNNKPTIDSSVYYDDLLTELDSFLDSLTQPRTMFLFSVNAGKNYLNFRSATQTDLKSQSKFMITPSLGYFHRSGFGLTGSSVIVRESNKWNAFQYLLTGSFDYLQHQRFGAGVSLTHFFTEDSLSFYTSPLQNEASVYVAYKDWWIKPILSASYGWGSQSSFEERKDYITTLRLRPRGYTRVESTETVSDFSLVASVKHDFNWLNKLGSNSLLRFTPQLSFTSGTQKFGFNQTSSSYTQRLNGSNVLYNSDNVYLDDALYFQPLSLDVFLKTELSVGKFFVQPQLIFDYYFPAENKKLTSVFRVNAGVSF